MKVKWTQDAQEQFRKILRFYNRRNASVRYSNRLQKEIRALVKCLQMSPEFGEYLDREDRRRVCIEYFELLYVIKPECVEIVCFRDARREAED